MKYRIVVSAEFERESDKQLGYMLDSGVQNSIVDAWHSRLSQALDRLESMPRMHAVSEEHCRPDRREVRRLVFGRFLVYYAVHEDAHAVHLLSLRHGAQQSIDLLPDAD